MCACVAYVCICTYACVYVCVSVSLYVYTFVYVVCRSWNWRVSRETERSYGTWASKERVMEYTTYQQTPEGGRVGREGRGRQWWRGKDERFMKMHMKPSISFAKSKPILEENWVGELYVDLKCLSLAMWMKAERQPRWENCRSASWGKNGQQHATVLTGCGGRFEGRACSAPAGGCCIPHRQDTAPHQHVEFGKQCITSLDSS